jgi:hypothetical protein
VQPPITTTPIETIETPPTDTAAIIPLKAITADAPQVKTKVKVAKKEATISSVTLAFPSGAGIGYKVEIIKYGKTTGAPVGWEDGKIFVSDGSPWKIEGLDANTSYKFRITPLQMDGTAQTNAKGKSLAATITAKTAKYAAVSKVKASKVDSDGFVTLTWATPRTPAAGAEYTAYEIACLQGKNDKVGTPLTFVDLTPTSVKIAYTDLQSLGKQTLAVRAIAGDLTSLDGKITITPSKLA